MDNLSKCMIQCKADGFGVHYGAWRAAQGDTIEVKTVIPEGWRECEYCGKLFKPYNKRLQRFCEAGCQVAAANARYKEKRAKEVSSDGSETVGE